MKQILIIDNYDSFTHNIKHYLETLGKQVLLLENDDAKLDDIDALHCSHIILSPGPGNPNQAGRTLEVIARYHQHYPMLGVCMGHQCLAQYFGARIVHTHTVMHGKLSTLHHDDSILFNGLPKNFNVMRYHSLLIEQSNLPNCLTMTGWTQDPHGNVQEIMAIQHQDYPVFGIQYHPEAVLTEYGYEIFHRFLATQPINHNN